MAVAPKASRKCPSPAVRSRCSQTSPRFPKEFPAARAYPPRRPGAFLPRARLGTLCRTPPSRARGSTRAPRATRAPRPGAIPAPRAAPRARAPRHAPRLRPASPRPAQPRPAASPRPPSPCHAPRPHATPRTCTRTPLPTPPLHRASHTPLHGLPRPLVRVLRTFPHSEPRLPQPASAWLRPALHAPRPHLPRGWASRLLAEGAGRAGAGRGVRGAVRGRVPPGVRVPRPLRPRCAGASK